MNKSLALLVVGLATGVAVADIPPPPGFKRVSIEYKVTTDTAYPDYVFYAVNPYNTARPIEFTPTAPLIVNRGHPLAEYSLVAVPRETQKKYGAEKDFVAALIKDQVPGVLRAKEHFTTRGVAKHTFRGDRVTIEYRVEKLSPSSGLVLARVKGGDELVNYSDLPAEPLEPRDSTDGPSGPPIGAELPVTSPPQSQPAPALATDAAPALPATPTFASRNGMWVAGIATAAAVVFAGFWLASRSRRR